MITGARQAQACEVLGLSERTLQRWQIGETVHCDQRPLRDYQPPHKSSARARSLVLLKFSRCFFFIFIPSAVTIMITKFKFTQKSIDSLPPHSKDSRSTDQEYSDSIVSGLKLLVGKNGNK